MPPKEKKPRVICCRLHSDGEDPAEKCLEMCDWGPCREWGVFELSDVVAPVTIPGVGADDWPVRLCRQHMRILVDLA